MKKTIGIVLVAVLAMGCISASSSSIGTARDTWVDDTIDSAFGVPHPVRKPVPEVEMIPDGSYAKTHRVSGESLSMYVTKLEDGTEDYLVTMYAAYLDPRSRHYNTAMCSFILGYVGKEVDVDSRNDVAVYDISLLDADRYFEDLMLEGMTVLVPQMRRGSLVGFTFDSPLDYGISARDVRDYGVSSLCGTDWDAE